jgi:Ca2+-binding EF-hand superfamily protein
MGVDLSDDVSEELMNLLDADGNGTVSFNEFVDTLFPGGRA